MYLTELDLSNEKLAFTEVKALSGDNIKNSDQKKERRILKPAKGITITLNLDHYKLGMSHRILEYIGNSSATQDEIIEMIYDKIVNQNYDFQGSFRVRVKKISEEKSDLNSEKLEEKIGNIIYKKGHKVELEEPDERFRLLISEDKAYFGRVISEKENFQKRKPTNKPFFQPGSMPPKLARCLTNIAGGYNGNLLLDPMCGTGGILIEGKLAGSEIIGFDSQKKMAKGAYKNLSHYFNDDSWNVCIGDAKSLPINQTECAVADLPYGRASKVDAESTESLYKNSLRELKRVVRGKIVIISDKWLDRYIRKVNLNIINKVEDRVHGSLTRKIHILN